MNSFHLKKKKTLYWGLLYRFFSVKKKYLGCSCMIFSSIFSRLVVRYESILYTSFSVFLLFHFPLFFVLIPLFPSNFLWVVTSSHWTHSNSLLLQSMFLMIYILFIYLLTFCFQLIFTLFNDFFVSLLIFLIILILLVLMYKGMLHLEWPTFFECLVL